MSESSATGGGYAADSLHAQVAAVGEEHGLGSLHVRAETGEVHHEHPGGADPADLKAVHDDLAAVDGVKSVGQAPEAGPAGEGWEKVYPADDTEKDVKPGEEEEEDSGGIVTKPAKGKPPRRRKGPPPPADPAAEVEEEDEDEEEDDLDGVLGEEEEDEAAGGADELPQTIAELTEIIARLAEMTKPKPAPAPAPGKTPRQAAEEDLPEEEEETRAAMDRYQRGRKPAKVKRLHPDHLKTIKAAADAMHACSMVGAKEWTDRHKRMLHMHARALDMVHGAHQKAEAEEPPPGKEPPGENGESDAETQTAPPPGAEEKGLTAADLAAIKAEFAGLGLRAGAVEERLFGLTGV